MTSRHRLAGLCLDAMALMALFASTSVTVDVLPLSDSDATRQALFATVAQQRTRIRRGWQVSGIVLLLPAIWLVVDSSMMSTRK